MYRRNYVSLSSYGHGVAVGLSTNKLIGLSTVEIAPPSTSDVLISSHVASGRSELTCHACTVLLSIVKSHSH
jgi:hypothetical protein